MLTNFSGRKAFHGAILTSAAQLSKIAAGFLLLKLIAIYLGTDGMGAVGNFMSLATLLSLIAGGGIVNGVIKYVAALRDRNKYLLEFVSSAIIYSLVFSICVLIIGIIFSNIISEYIFGDASKYYLIIILAFAQLGFAFANLVTGVSNGLMDTKTYALIQIVGNLTAIPLSLIMISRFHFLGCVLSIILFYFSYSLPAYFFYRKSSFYKRKLVFSNLSSHVKNLSVYTLMACIGALSVPLVEIIVRAEIINSIDYNSAGIWQASIKLSSAYIGFFTVFLAVYFMPLVVSIKNNSELAKMVFRFIFIVMIVFLIGGVGFYSLRQELIPILLSSQFSALESLIKYQLIGDFFRVSSYVIGFLVIAKSSLKIYLFSEIAQGVLFFLLSYLFLNQEMGLKGVFLANLLMNIIYFIISILGLLAFLKISKGDKSAIS